MRLVTWNIHHGAPAAGGVDLDAIAEVLRRCDADVVVLQEVDRRLERSGLVDQASWLGEDLSMVAHFVPAMAPWGGEYGNAILTRLECGVPRVVRLPHRRQREPRVAAVVEVHTDAGRVTVAGTHLQNVPRLEKPPTEAMRQLDALLEDLAGVQGPVVLAGDVNTEARRVRPVLRAAGFETAITAATFPSDRPRRTIDVVAVRGLRILESRVPVTTASDHRPVVVDLAHL